MAVALSIHSLTPHTEVKDSWSYSADFPVCVQCVDRERTLPFLVDEIALCIVYVEAI